MTTSTYSSVLNHTTDAGFRAWGSELSANLALVGLVQTADSGQINWTTAARGANYTASGYEIWRFADSSIFIKFEYGNGGLAAPGTTPTPGIWVTVGTGSNGSGTITGQTSARTDITGVGFISSSSSINTTTNYTTYVCATTDAFSLVFKANGGLGGAWPAGTICIGKTVDNTGAATNVGYGLLNGQTGFTQVTSGSATPGQSGMQSVRTLAPVQTFNQALVGYAAIPGNPTSGAAGSIFQIYPVWLNVPQVLPFNFACAYAQADVLKLSTFSVAIAGTTPHTYLALGALGLAPTVAGQSGTTYGLAFIFE